MSRVGRKPIVIPKGVNVSVSAGTVAVSAVTAAWVATNPDVMHALGPPEFLAQYVDYDFANYYMENPRSSFAAQVWTNNAWVAAQAIIFGVAFGLPTLAVMLINALNVGAGAGIMIAHGQADVFFGLILPHAVRLLVGSRHRALLPLSALAGAIFLVWADTGARTLFDPRELPVGILTALIGGPVFAVLLLRGRRLS